MSAQATVRKLSIEEYLSDPELERFEWVDGHAVETGVGNKNHGAIQLQCGYLLKLFLRSQTGFYAATELRCRLVVHGEVRFRLPDLCVVAGSRRDGDTRYLEGAPLLAVEVQSPENSVAQLMRKVDEYFLYGCKMAWLVLPEEESVLVRRPSEDVKSCVKGDLLEGGDVLPGLRINVAELFEE